MKAGAFLALAIVGVGTAPLLLLPGVGWMGMPDVERALSGEDLRRVAAGIAEREFTPDVGLAVLARERVDRVVGEFGETIRPRDGHVFERQEIRVENRGRLEIGVHTYHFSAIEDTGRAHRAETGIAARFEIMGVQRGSAAQGVVVFEVPEGAVLSTLFWQGEIANATLALSP